MQSQPQTQPYHTPALLTPTLKALNIRSCSSGIFVDLTFGGGGHSRAILSQLSQSGSLYAFDLDSDAFCNAPGDGRFHLIHGNFRHFSQYLRYLGISSVDGIIADLGVSFHQFDTPQRGFSFRFDSPIDMRMNAHSALSAADILNTASEDDLFDIFRNYGELHREARSLSKAILKHRMKTPIVTTSEFAALVTSVSSKDKKVPMAQAFQALRIATGDELQSLRLMLQSSIPILRHGGVLCIITYHSLEDRLVKQFFKTGTFDSSPSKDFFGRDLSPFRPSQESVITPTLDEIASNPRSRSAKLRYAVRI